MNQKETFNGTVKNNDLDLLVRFYCGDDLVHLRKHLWTEDIEWWMVKCDSPVGRRQPSQTYLLVFCCSLFLTFHVCLLILLFLLIPAEVVFFLHFRHADPWGGPR